MKYPIGIQSFQDIRDKGYVYVDKTDLIYQLVTTGKIYFLSRPRRFGKSLLISTLKHYFLGHKELFKGLAIEQLEKDWFEYPVFHIDFNGSDFTQAGKLAEIIEGHVTSWERIYGKSPDFADVGIRFAYVLEQAHEQTGRTDRPNRLSSRSRRRAMPSLTRLIHANCIRLGSISRPRRVRSKGSNTRTLIFLRNVTLRVTQIHATFFRERQKKRNSSVTLRQEKT